MPYFSIRTSKTVNEPEKLARKASAFIADLVGKPESYVMAAVLPDTAMTFGGSAQPSAFIELKSLGLAEEKCSPYAEKICAFVQAELEIEPNRIFIDFPDIQRTRFAWNGKTFG